MADPRLAGPRFSAKCWPRGYAHADGTVSVHGDTEEEVRQKIRAVSMSATIFGRVCDNHAEAARDAAMPRLSREQINYYLKGDNT